MDDANSGVSRIVTTTPGLSAQAFMDISDLRIFSRLAAVQNLSSVGQEFALTPGTISKRLQSLEHELAVRLFDRTTRSIRITQEGRIFLEHAERMLGEYDAARGAMGETTDKPGGLLKIASPPLLAGFRASDAIAQFLNAYPEVDLQAELTDRPVNLQEEGFDAVIRTGQLMDSALKARRLSDDPHVVVASPAYIARRGTPRRPRDIERHACLVQSDQWQWTFVKRGTSISVRVNARLRANDVDTLKQAAREGHGLIRTSAGAVRDDIASGCLVPVLEDYDTSANSGIWAVHLGGKYVPPRLRAFLDFLPEWLRGAQAAEARMNGALVNGAKKSKNGRAAAPAAIKREAAPSSAPQSLSTRRARHPAKRQNSASSRAG